MAYLAEIRIEPEPGHLHPTTTSSRTHRTEPIAGHYTDDELLAATLAAMDALRAALPERD